MTKRNWFSVTNQFNVNDENDLFGLINFLIEEARAEFAAADLSESMLDTTAVEDTTLACQMLSDIGVRCAKAS